MRFRTTKPLLTNGKANKQTEKQGMKAAIIFVTEKNLEYFLVKRKHSDTSVNPPFV